MRALHSIAALDEEAVGGAIRRMEETRARGMAPLARRLGEQDALRPDVTVEDAAHLLWLLTSVDAFDQLYANRGLSAEDTTRMSAPSWLIRTAWGLPFEILGPARRHWSQEHDRVRLDPATAEDPRWYAGEHLARRVRVATGRVCDSRGLR